MKDWLTRIQEARARGQFTADDRMASACWATCAVGEHHTTAPDIIVYTNANPVDPAWRFGGPKRYADLLKWGSDFHSAVVNNDPAEAEHIYHTIADRALQLQREQG